MQHVHLLNRCFVMHGVLSSRKDQDKDMNKQLTVLRRVELGWQCLSWRQHGDRAARLKRATARLSL